MAVWQFDLDFEHAVDGRDLSAATVSVVIASLTETPGPSRPVLRCWRYPRLAHESGKECRVFCCWSEGLLDSAMRTDEPQGVPGAKPLELADAHPLANVPGNGSCFSLAPPRKRRLCRCKSWTRTLCHGEGVFCDGPTEITVGHP